MQDNSLFNSKNMQDEPLASRMRARTLNEYIGQDHIIGEGRLLRRCITADRLSSVIFYGPPGVGKTTLAKVIANHTKSFFITLNAVLTGVADIRAAIKEATEHLTLYSQRTILFVDEVHRWNKAQQDALLPYVENGTIILIGATTENPFFEVNRALVSRSRIFSLRPLTRKNLLDIAKQALEDKERGYGNWQVTFEVGALEHLVDSSGGDARSLLNALELAVETTPPVWRPYASPPIPAYNSTIYISREAAEQSIQKKVVLYDKDGDYHYDVISAFIKSLRGRDVDAALYWLARMIAAGEDPHFIFRRMLISACEDTGMASPYAISIVSSCAAAFDRVGLPEGRYFLAHAAIFLSTCPKSNSSMAFFDALKVIENTAETQSNKSKNAQEESETYGEVPNHLKDASRDDKGLGHGAGYKYPHSYTDHWVAQQYLPRELVGRVFYTPSEQGYEKTIKEEVLARRETQIAIILDGVNKEGEENKKDGSKVERIGYKSKSSTFIQNALTRGVEESEEERRSTYSEHNIAKWWEGGSFNNSTENLTFSPEDKKKEDALTRADNAWRVRVDVNKAEVLLAIRNRLITISGVLRYHRCLIWNADNGLLLWELLRKCPEGIVAGVCRSQGAIDILTQYGRTLEEIDKPLFMLRGEGANNNYLTQEEFNKVLVNFEYKGAIFDRLFFQDPFSSIKSIEALSLAIKEATRKEKEKEVGKAFTDDKEAGKYVMIPSDKKSYLADNYAVLIVQRIPCKTQYISDLVKNQVLGEKNLTPYLDTLNKMREAEVAFFSNKENDLFNWEAKTIKEIFCKNGFKVEIMEDENTEKRRITYQDVKNWFNTSRSLYGKAIYEAIGDKAQNIVNLLINAGEKRVYNWKTCLAYFRISS